MVMKNLNGYIQVWFDYQQLLTAVTALRESEGVEISQNFLWTASCGFAFTDWI